MKFRSLSQLTRNRGQLVIIGAIVAFSALFGLLLFQLNPQEKPAFERQLFGEWEYKSSIPQALTAYYKKNDTDVTVRVERGSNALEFSYPFQNTTIVYADNTLIYKSQNLPIETRYNVVPGGIKEEIILHKIPQENIFSSVINTQGVTPSISNEGIIAFYDTNGEYQFHFERPFVKDATGAVSYAVRYNLKKTDGKTITNESTRNDAQVTIPLLAGGKKSVSTVFSSNDTYVLDIEVDPNWLHNPSRVLPITIDPTVTHNTTALFATGEFNNTIDAGNGSLPQLESSYQELVADQYTVGLWHMNEASGNVLDSSGDSNTGTPTGTSVTNGVIGNARSFNGSSDFLTVANASSFPQTGEVTVEAWFKTTESANTNTIVNHGTTSDWLYIMNKTPTNQLNCKWYQANSGSDYLQASSSALVNDGKWHHGACVFTDEEVSVYVDGRLEGTDVGKTGVRDITTAGGLVIGKFNWTTPYYFTGQIDEVRISRVARTPEEIKAAALRRPSGIYTSEIIDLTKVSAWNSFTWTEGGVQTGDGETPFNATNLVAHWKLNESSGTTATNNAGSCGATCNGTLSGFSNTSARDVTVSSGWTQENRKWGEGALMFDGINDMISVGDVTQFDGLSQLTISAWIYPEYIPVGSIYHAIVAKADYTAAGNAFFMRMDDTAGVRFAVRDASSNQITCDTGAGVLPPVGEWTHIVGTITSDDKCFIYFNGVQKSTSSNTAFTTIQNTTTALKIGSSDYASEQWFEGVIDSVSIYSRAWTPAEVISNYNVGAVELQTRVGNSANPDDGTWEAWTPTTKDTLINSFDSITPPEPDSLTGLALWLKADAINGYSDGQALPSWSDSSGNNRTFTQANGSQQPAYKTSIINGKPVVRFTAASSQTMTNATNFSTPSTVIYLSRQTGGTNGRILSGLANNWLLGYHGGYKRQAYFNGWVSQIHESLTDTNWHVYTSTHNGTFSQVYEDGNLFASGPNGIQGPNGLALVGYLGTSEFSNADIAEVIVYNRVLSETERKKIERYLANKYNLILSTQPNITTDSVVKTEGAISTAIRSSIATDSAVVAYWKLDEVNGSGAYLKDASGFGNHATPSNTTTVPGISGRAMSFNGTTAYVSASDANSLDISTGISLEAWIKLNNTTGYQTIVGKRDASLGEFNYGFRTNGDELEYYFLGGGVTHIASSQNSNLLPNRWYHVAVTYDTYKPQFYVDGVRQSSTCTANTCTGVTTTSDDAVSIGRPGDLNAQYFNGVIDEVRITNLARSPEEIKRSATFSQQSIHSFSLSPVDLRNKKMLAFQIAGDRPGNYLSVSVGENEYSQYQSDSNVIGHWKMDEGVGNQYNGVAGYPVRDSAGGNHGESSIKYDNFNTSDATFWTYNLTYHTAPTNLGGENVLNVLGTGAGYVSYYQTTPTITSGQEVVFDFYRTATTYWHMGALTTTGGHRWAIQEDQIGGLRVQYSPDAVNYYYPKTLIATAATSTWYRVLLRVDDVNGFYMAIWNRSDPRTFAEYTNALMPTGQTWRFQGWQYQATNSYIDNFQIRSANPEKYVDSGKVGKSMKFDGDNFVNLYNPSALQMTGNQTIEMWLYPTDFTLRRNPYNKSYGGEGTITQETNRTLNYFYGTAGADTTPYQGFNSSTPLTINQWNHVALVRDLSGLTLTWYINGVKTNSTTASYASATASSLNAMIGNGYTNKYVGKIDELRISGVARSQEEIRQSYEYGLRTHPITIEFGARLDSGNLITDTNDLSFTVDGTSYGLSQKGSKLFRGDKIIVRENYNGTEYKAQGTVTSIVPSTGATTVASWDAGSVVPPGGFTVNADVFKWQTEYWNITTPLNTHVDSTSQLLMRITNGEEGRNVWLDNLTMGSDYLTNPLGSTITSSTGNRYFQYRSIFHSGDEAVSASMSAVSMQYTINTAPNTPSLNSPANTATSVSRTPSFYTTSTDTNSDYLQYKITLCTDSNMTQNCQTFDQTQSQTGWSGQNADSNTAYNSATQGIYTLSTPLNYWTTYYWKSTAIDPDGINTWSGTQVSPYSFTTTPIEPATNCKVTRVGTTNVIEWTDNASIEAGYAIQKNVNGGGWTNLNMALGVNTVSYIDSPVQNNTTYQYRVAPYIAGPQYTSWCETSTQNISVGTLRFEGNFNFSGIEVQ